MVARDVCDCEIIIAFVCYPPFLWVIVQRPDHRARIQAVGFVPPARLELRQCRCLGLGDFGRHWCENARMLMVGPFLLMIGVVLNLSDFAFDLGLNMAGETHYIFVRTKWVIAKDMLCQIVAGLVV